MKDRKIRVGIDLDDVVINTTESILEYINERLPVCLTLDDITDYAIEKALPKQFHWIVESGFRDKEMWKKVYVTDAAYKYIKKLYEEGFEIYFVTSSLAENLRKKIKHLERSLNFLPKEFCWKNTINIHNKQLLDLDFLIDDCAANLTGDRRYYSICFDKPWNRYSLAKENSESRIERCYTWEDVYTSIKDIIKIKSFNN